MLSLDLTFEFIGFQIHPNFTVSRGEVIGLQGPSGIGKTTILKTIAGLSSPQKGTISWKDQIWNKNQIIKVKSQKRNTALVFQDFALFPNLTVHDNITYGLKMALQEMKEMIDILELESLINVMPDRLSGGQKQRVALARALAASPDILLLDEPFSALDDNLKSNIKNFLKKYIDDHQCAVVISSHDMSDLKYFGDQIIRIL